MLLLLLLLVAAVGFRFKFCFPSLCQSPLQCARTSLSICFQIRLLSSFNVLIVAFLFNNTGRILNGCLKFRMTVQCATFCGQIQMISKDGGLVLAVRDDSH